MRSKFTAVLMLSALAQPIGVSAATPVHVIPPVAPQAAKPDPATVAEAVRLLDADEFDKTAVRSTELMVGLSLANMVSQMQKMYGDKMPADLVGQVRTVIHDYAMSTMRAHLADMKRQTAELYAEQFTRAELIRLRELHSDPVAVKAREKGEVMQPRLMMIGVQTMRAAQPELDAKIKQMVTEYISAHNGSSPSKSSS